MKRKLSKVFLTTILFVLTTMTLVACGQSEAVTFRDPLVERCVREELGKSATAAITKKDCENLKKLTIDSRKDIGLNYNEIFHRLEYQNYVDLSDLQYLTGLKELRILPYVSDVEYCDNYVGLSAISSCKKLTKLAILTDKEIVEEKWGYKYLADLVKELPDLKTLEFGSEVPERYQTILKGENNKLDFVFEERGVNTREYWWPIEIECMNLEELPEDTEDIALNLHPGDEVDFSSFARFKHLKQLTIWCDVERPSNNREKFEKDQLFKVYNIDALKDNKELFSLNLCGAYGDFDGIGELSQLKELSMVTCILGEPTFLSKLSELRELTFCLNYATHFSDYLTEKNFPKLAFLRTNKSLLKNMDTVAELKDLKMLSLQEALGMTYRDDEPVSISEIAKCKQLEYLELYLRECENLEAFAQLKNLKYLMIASSEKMTGLSSVLELPELYGAYMVTGGMTDASEDVREMIEACRYPKLSVFVNSRYSNFMGAIYARNGLDGLKDYVRERMEGFKACVEANICNGGYEAALFSFRLESMQELEDFLAK
ncbi:MAG: hypothetical protein K6F51_04300 [Acetatifactor sp.]|nr:hypothetical protein [Acetatifactor sp.]